MPPIRVLHVLDVEKEAHYFNNLVDNIDPDEIELSFVTLAGEGPFSESMRSRGRVVYALNVKRRIEAIRVLRDLWGIYMVVDPAIVHTHSLNPTIGGLILARLTGRKTVTTRHHSDAIHLLSNKLKRKFYLYIEQLNVRNADHIIAPSRMVKTCLVDWENAPIEKVTVIPYGQTTTRFDAITPVLISEKRKELGMNDQLSLVCVSRLYHAKGHKYLFEALAPLIKSGLECRVYLVGEGDHRQVLESQLNSLGISENIVFLGFRSDVLEIIAAADLIVHPSLEDALSQSLIESLMLARPIIATDISGASDTLDNGRYGVLVPPADSLALRTAIQNALKDLTLASEKAAEGKAFILDYMNAKRCAGEYATIYKELAAGQSI